MKHFSKIQASLLLLIVFLSFGSDLFSAPPPPPMGPPCWPPPCVPIDGGLLFLIIAGMGLGGWKLYSTFYRKNPA